jgi:colicin import membrane protein
VHWHTEEPAGVEAELWAATPQLAAPPQTAPPPPEPAQQPVATKPAPAVAPPVATAERDAQIALEKAEQKRQQKQEQDRQDKLKAAQAKRDKAEADRKEAARQQAEQQAKDAKAEKAAEAQREKLRLAQLQRMNAQLNGTGAPGSTGTAARDAGPSAGYGGRVIARVYPNILALATDNIPGNPTAEVEVRLAADGSIIGRRIFKESGVKAWDDLVLRAIDRTGALPRDIDGRAPPTIIITFHRKE